MRDVIITWAVRIVIGICVVSLVSLFILEIRNGQGVDTECADGYRCHDYTPVAKGPFAATLADASAFWTAIASLVGIVALCFIWFQFRNENRSLENDMNSNRGLLGFRASKRRSDKVDVVLQNIGNGPLFLTEFAMEVQWSPFEGDADLTIFEDQKTMRLPIPKDGLISTFPMTDQGHTIPITSNKIPADPKPEGKRMILVQVHAAYETIYGQRYVWGYTYFIDPDAEHDAFLGYSNERFTFDRLMTRQEAKHRGLA